MQSDNEIKEIFKVTTSKINNPLLQNDLESLLIENGLETDLKPIQIKKFMSEFGFVKKQRMFNGFRDRYWISDMFKETDMAKKIRLNRFLKTYLADLDFISNHELTEVLIQNNFPKSIFDKHFYYDDQTFKIMNGWIMSGKIGERVYKKLTPKPSQTDEQDIFLSP